MQLVRAHHHRSLAAGQVSADSSRLALAHWRRTVAEMYADVRATASADPARAAARFRARREQLFREHPDSPVPAAKRGGGPVTRWYPWDPAWHVVGEVTLDSASMTFEIPLAADGTIRCSRVGTVQFAIGGVAARLAMYWFEGYGGGLWLPFSDATNGKTTYGGGRYLYDTIKGADLGAHPERMVLDFNYAYNPSCVYDNRWSCPLSPLENRLTCAITAGEQSPERLVP